MSSPYPILKIGDVCEILDRRRKPITKRNRVAGPYPYYGATGVLDYVEGYLFDEPLVLIGEDGAKWGKGENSAYMITGKTWVNNHAHVVSPNRDILLDQWLTYYLNFADLMPYISGLTVPKLNQKMLRTIPIPLPLLPEQKRIVEILDEAFEAIDKAIANTERNIRNAEELIRNRVSEIFSEAKLKWPTSTLEEVSGITMGQSPPGISYNSSGNGVPLVNGPVEFGGLHPFSRTVASKFTTKPTKLCQKGDLILCVRGSTTGRMNIAGYDSCIGRGVAAISPKHSQDWIYRYISFIQGEIFALGTGSTFPNISKKSLGSIVIPIPPEGVQQSYYSMLEILDSKCSELIQINRAKLLLLANLKQSILQKAFTGELTKDLRALDKALSEAGV